MYVTPFERSSLKLRCRLAFYYHMGHSTARYGVPLLDGASTGRLSCGVTLQRSEAMYSYSGRCCMIVCLIQLEVLSYFGVIVGPRSHILPPRVCQPIQIQALREAFLVNATTLNCPHNNNSSEFLAHLNT